MESIVLLFLASASSVLFGWQPMPEDDQRIEYIVQIEPELAATLREGQSLPITSDIPKDIGPIGRIRIVVGRDALPKIGRTTHFKPWPTQAQGNGLIETQFATPADTNDRYGNPSSQANLAGQNNSQILPPGGGNNPADTAGSATRTASPFAATIQRSAAEAQRVATNVKQPILPPSGKDLFGKNNIQREVQTAINNTSHQLQNDWRQGVSQVASQAQGQLRQATSELGQGVQNTAKSFGQSLLPNSSNLVRGAGANAGQPTRQPSENRTILPPQSQPSHQAINAPFSGKAPRIDTGRGNLQQQQQQPRYVPSNDIASLPPAATPAFSPATTLAADNRRTNAEQNFATNSPPQDGVFNAPWPDTKAPANKNFERSPQPGAASSTAPRNWSNTTGHSDDNSGHRRETHSGSPDSKSADYNSGSRVAYTPSSSAPSNGGFSPPAHPFAGDRPPNGNFGPGIGGRKNEIRGSGFNQSDDQESSQDGRNGHALWLVVSWVSLVGSGAGNAFLLWSYLGVRNKYYDVVHSSSPKRRDRYDD